MGFSGLAARCCDLCTANSSHAFRLKIIVMISLIASISRIVLEEVEKLKFQWQNLQFVQRRHTALNP